MKWSGFGGLERLSFSRAGLEGEWAGARCRPQGVSEGVRGHITEYFFVAL